MTDLARGCRPFRPALEALVEHGERGLLTASALDHLGICRTCEQELTELALTVAALRHAGRELRGAPVPAPSAARVAALASTRRSPWSWRLQVGSLLTGAAIAALVVIPRSGTAAWSGGDVTQSVRPPVTAGWRMAENRIAAEPDSPSYSVPANVPPRYPEGLLRPWKEVSSSDAAPREFRPR